jgi:hypothetical protein
MPLLQVGHVHLGPGHAEGAGGLREGRGHPARWHQVGLAQQVGGHPPGNGVQAGLRVCLRAHVVPSGVSLAAS